MKKKAQSKKRKGGRVELINASRSPSPSPLPASSSPLVSAERVKAHIRSRFNPIRNLTPELLAQYLDSFKVGYIKQAALIWNDIEERDDTLASVIPKAKKAVARNGWEIVTIDTEDEATAAAAQKHKEALLHFYNNITVTNALDENERGELSLLVRQMLDAVGKRYAVHEILWKPSPEGITADFRFAPLWFFENTTGKLRFLRSDSSLLGEGLEEGRWLVTVSDGLMYACSIAYIYKQLSLKDWVIYNERHGMPGIHGKTDAVKDTDEWDDMAEAIENFASDWSIITNSGATLEKIDMATTGQLPYPPLVDRMSRAMAAIWRGADLSTMSAGSGQGQGASLQQSESDILEEDRAALISETLSRQIDRRVIAETFGPGVVPLAYIKIKTATKKNIAQDIEIDTFLRDSGVPLSSGETAERYGRSVAEEGEPALVKPASPALPPFANERRIAVRNSDTPTLPHSDTQSAIESARTQIVTSAVDQTLAERRAQLDAWFAALEASLPEKGTPAEFIAIVEAAIKAMPAALLTPENVARLAKIGEGALGASVANAVAARQASEGGAA